IDESDKVVWTPEVPDKQALRDLLHFKSYLIKDGYSEDFQKDFADFYINEGFYNAPHWFADDPSGKFADYFNDRDYLWFTQRYIESDQLPNAGLYDVVLDVDFVGDDWDLFDVYAQPNAKVKVEMYLLRAPKPNSIFYYLPFNGNIGVETSNGRQGYGINYENASSEILISTGGDLVQTATIAGSTPVMRVNTDVVNDFKQINATASNRGFLLSIEDSGDPTQKNLSFYPNFATPVVMKMHSVKTDNPFAAFFELREAGTPLETGGNLTFWEGMGQCLDFTGVPVYSAFDYKPDREAKQTDSLPNWQFAYANDWEKAVYAGDVYLKTVFYTPVGRGFDIRATMPSSLVFITPNSVAAQSAALNGIGNMTHNSAAAMDSIRGMSDVLDLVKEGKACVVNSGTKTAFWWNPKSLYETAGTNTSVKALEQSLKAGQNCIGYGQ
ncbi:MAG: hypothetical protein NTW59_03395, partial [Candidatus Diapherotrites archaeon]|nr:hypothetical protein [Candidatus Diapherotrites archaeon]